jgi:hypothetical protein
MWASVSNALRRRPTVLRIGQFEDTAQKNAKKDGDTMGSLTARPSGDAWLG